MKKWLSKVQRWFGAKTIQPRMQVMHWLAERALEVVFQPMVDLRSGVILGHEALVRAPRHLAHAGFQDMLEAAQRQSCLNKFELACMELAMEQWMASYGKGQLFVNFSAQTLVQLHASDAAGTLLELMHQHQVSPRRIGIEVNGYTRQASLDALADALRPLREAGVTIALDNFKATERSMQVWARVSPQVIKLSPRWTHNIVLDEGQSRAMRSMVRVSGSQHTLLVAKSVESEEELRMMRVLGVDMAQGFFLGSPAEEPVPSLNLRARGVLHVPAERVAAMVAAPAPVPASASSTELRQPGDTRYSLLS
nr:EAL domain-containing protein [uncultured Rhodoferax sp.]